MEKISVIVPVYNSAKYLETCLDSILRQDYETLEIVLVNDASRDGRSAEICREYAGNHQNIKYMELPEMIGIAGTRNVGLDAAEGAYILFVDSDDYLSEPSAVSGLYAAIKAADADIAVGNYFREIGGKLVCAARHGFSAEEGTDSPDFRYRGFFSNGILSYVWGKLYAADFLKRTGIRFDDLAYAEDKLFNIKCFYHAPVYCFTEENVYCYRFNPESASHEYREGFDKNWMELARLAGEEFEKCACPDPYEDVVVYTILFATFFHAKQEYRFQRGKIRAIRRALKTYESYPLAVRAFAKSGEYAKRLSPGFWRTGIRLYGFCMKRHWYGLTAFGILLAAAMKLDAGLSSTGIVSRSVSGRER